MTDAYNAPEEPRQEPKTIQIAPDAPVTVRIGPLEDGKLKAVEEFESSRNVTTALLPKFREMAEKHAEELGGFMAEISLKGKDPHTGNELEMITRYGSFGDVLNWLEIRAISNDEAIMASTSFFQDMFDMVDLKAVMMVAVFDKGQASYVLTNRTVEVGTNHMLRLVATTLAQLDKLRAHMEANGITMPGGSKILTPDSAEFHGILQSAKGG